MIKWAQFPFVRITLVFMAGIGLGLMFPDLTYYAIFLFLAVLCATGCLFLMAKARKSGFLFSVTGLAGLICFGLAGLSLTFLRTAKNDPENLFHLQGKVTHYTGKINDFILEKPTIFQTTLKLSQVKVNGNWRPVTGNVQLSVRKEPGLELRYGQLLLVKGAPRLVPAPLNPGQFNYRTYLASQQIYHQHYLYPNLFTVTGEEVSNPFMALSMQLRANLDQLLKSKVPGKREYGIATALVLGIKDQLDNEIKATYANTGTMPVLAVSGLHVGLVFGLLNLGLKRLRKTTAQRLLSAAIIFSVVWVYAFITALSASVLRAAVMFTILMVAQVLQKKSNMYNTLAVAAFGLMCVNPYYLLDVGFQLSFLAVLAIVYIYPRLHRLYEPETWLGRQIWGLLCISLAAQIGTFPLSLFYFHQFPVYFLLTNLIAVPLSTVILYVGFGILLVFWIPGVGAWLASWLGLLMKWLLWFMNEAMIFLEGLPLAQINRIPFSGLQAVLLFVIVMLLLIFLARPRFKLFLGLFALLVLFSGSQVHDKFTRTEKSRFIIFAAPGNSVWGFFTPAKATVLADSGFLKNKQGLNFMVEPAMLAAQPATVTYQPWQLPVKQFVRKQFPDSELIVWKGLRILALSKPVNYQLQQPLEIDLLVLQQNVYVTPEKLQANFQPRKIIFDSSNASWYVNWLSPKLKAAGIAVQDVNTEGALSTIR